MKSYLANLSALRSLRDTEPKYRTEHQDDRADDFLCSGIMEQPLNRR